MAVNISYISAVFSCSLWLLLGGFGVWLYRRVDFRCLPYVGLYLLVHFPLLDLMNAWFAREFLKGTPLLDWMGPLSPANGLSVWVMWMGLFSSLAALLIVLLFLSDFVSLLAQAGVKLDNKGVRALLLLRSISFSLGLAFVALAVASRLLWLRIVAN